MTNKVVTNPPLDVRTIDDIRSKARSKLIEYCKLNDVIGAQIFSILEINNKVLYYPLEDDDVWGFSEKIKGISFVCINTSIAYDKQVFAATHELYHLWFNNNAELILSKDLEEKENSQDKISINERKANRFAAEFLVAEELLLQEIKTYSIDKYKIEVKDVIKLSNLFVVPYKMMVKRLLEIKVIKNDAYLKLISLTDTQTEIWRNRLGLSLPVRENKIGLDNLIDKGMELYEKKLISIDKLEYLLGFAQLSLEQMGIVERNDYVPPTDEEFAELMGE